MQSTYQVENSCLFARIRVITPNRNGLLYSASNPTSRGHADKCFARESVRLRGAGIKEIGYNWSWATKPA